MALHKRRILPEMLMVQIIRLNSPGNDWFGFRFELSVPTILIVVIIPLNGNNPSLNLSLLIHHVTTPA